jgi:hypothetical protein
VLLPGQQAKLARGAKDKEHAMSQKHNPALAVIGVDIGKNSLHTVGLDQRGHRTAAEVVTRPGGNTARQIHQMNSRVDWSHAVWGSAGQGL